MIFLFVPETKQRTLEELDYIFAVPSRKFINYQLRKALPWWFKRWVLLKKDAKLEPLYHFDKGVEGTAEGAEPESSSDNERISAAAKS